jgi:hypothetical protein
MPYPNNNGRFHLYADAALDDSKDEGGLGAALWQEDKHGIKQVIGYTSRRLTTSEKNYPAFVAEMQAAVYGMTYFQHPNQLLLVPNRILNGSAKQPFFDVQIPFRIKKALKARLYGVFES